MKHQERNSNAICGVHFIYVSACVTALWKNYIYDVFFFRQKTELQKHTSLLVTNKKNPHRKCMYRGQSSIELLRSLSLYCSRIEYRLKLKTKKNNENNMNTIFNFFLSIRIF